MSALDTRLYAAVLDAMDSHTWTARKVTPSEFLDTLHANGYTVIENEAFFTSDAVIAPEPDSEWGGILQFQAEDR